MYKLLSVLAILINILFTDISFAHATAITATSPDGLTTLTSDGTTITITRDGSEATINQAGIIAFTFMDNTSALANRSDYGILIINVVSGQMFWLGYSYPDSECHPCNIGGEG